MDSLKFLVVSDFNARNLAGLLSNGKSGVAVEAKCAPFGQVMQVLLSASAGIWPPDLSGAVVWTSPEGVSEAYRKTLHYEKAPADELLSEVGEFAGALTRIPSHVKYIFVPTWALSHSLEGRRGLMDMDLGLGVSAALMRMNLKLAEAVGVDPRIRLFDSGRWIALHGQRSYDSRLWYAAKTPFSVDLFKEAARDFVAALRGLGGGARKVLVVDLDNTLWGGIVGEVGWQNLRLGGHDPVGEAYRDFQEALKALTRRGILLAIVSKNEEATALEAIRRHPEMILGLDDFAGWRINWCDKVQNIVALTSELNLGLDAAVFIDDSPVERARVREALPAVLVPDWPDNPVYYRSALYGLDCFDAPAVSEEDRNRTAAYVAERKRKQPREEGLSLDAWLETLALAVQVQELNEANLERTAQLLNKTNQMNLRTRRMLSRELARWASEPDHRLLTLRVTDKFGDYGLVGIAGFSVSRESRKAEITDFVLSCRVMGRKIEETMLHVLSAYARACGARTISAEYLPTPRNQPCLRFFEACATATRLAQGAFEFDVNEGCPLPQCVKLSWADNREAGEAGRNGRLASEVTRGSLAGGVSEGNAIGGER